jgi:hypothetical protein
MTDHRPDAGSVDVESAREFCNLLRANRDGQPCLLRQYGNTVEAGPLTIRFKGERVRITFYDPWDDNGDVTTAAVITGEWCLSTIALITEGLLTQLAVTP